MRLLVAQLIDVATGGHLWAERYDRNLIDILELQDDVTCRIVDALKVTLSPVEKARLADSETVNIDAYDCFLRGREAIMDKTKTRDTFEQAKKFFLRTLELDPNYSEAYALLGFAYSFDYQNRWTDDPDSSLGVAKKYAQQPIEKDSNEPLARCLAAQVAMFEKDLDRAKSEIDVALSLNPNLALAHNLRGTIHTYSVQPLTLHLPSNFIMSAQLRDT
jgi:adenylate cyclase